MIYLHKLLPMFVLPTGITLALLLVGLIRRKRLLIGLGLTVFWVCSTSYVSQVLVRATEGWSERHRGADMPNADAIVVLSEGRTVAPGRSAVNEWSDGDRFFGGVELFLAARAPLLVFTGGMSVWGRQGKPEGDELHNFAVAMGIPEQAVLTTGPVLNTAAEANAVASLLQARRTGTVKGAVPPRILLVTSAFHMRRARMLFEREGMSVIPFPVDFKAADGGAISLPSVLPSADAFAKTELMIREWYGLLYYGVRR